MKVLRYLLVFVFTGGIIAVLVLFFFSIKKSTGLTWGYINPNGVVTIDLEYEDAKDYSNGLAAVKQGGKWGFIDRHGNVKISFKYLETGSFSSDGVCWARDTTKAQVGYINKEGAWQIPPEFDKGQDMQNGLAVAGVWIGSSNSGSSSSTNPENNRLYSYGIIDRQGNWVKKFAADINDQNRWYEATDYNKGLMAVYLKTRLCGYVDTTGHFVIDPKYTDCGDFRDGMAIVENSNQEVLLINPKGQTIRSMYQTVASIGEDSVLTILGGSEAFLFKATDSTATTGPWEYAMEYTQERVVVLSDNAFTLRDTNDRIYGSEYGRMDHLSERRVAFGVKEEGFFEDYTWGYMDLNGTQKVQPKYVRVGPFKGGLARVALYE